MKKLEFLAFSFALASSVASAQQTPPPSSTPAPVSPAPAAPAPTPNIGEVYGDWKQDVNKTQGTGSNLFADVTMSLTTEVSISDNHNGTATMEWDIECKVSKELEGKQLKDVKTKNKVEVTLSAQPGFVIATATKGNDASKEIGSINAGDGEKINNFTCNNSFPTGAQIAFITSSQDTDFPGEMFMVTSTNNGQITGGVVLQK